ncbi:MAG: DUF262 domain-containing protein [Candidatus Omnitrophota bacterium]
MNKRSFFEEFESNNSQKESVSEFSHIKESERKVYIDKDQFSIFEFSRRSKRGEIDLKPSYQRKEVWTIKKSSRLIESVLLSIPIPLFYLAELENEKKEVVDGQQRLNAFFNFLNNKFKLEKLEILDHLNGKTFEELSPNLQRRFEDYQLTFFLIKKESHPDIRFDVFQRVNEGATKLNAQELRNGIYRGYRIEFLNQLANEEFFKKMVNNKLEVNRLKDQEAVLRFLAFNKGYDKYSGNPNAFLNETLEELPPENSEVYSQLKTVFSNTMETIYLVFGPDAFIKDASKKKKINLSLFDVLCYSFSQFDKEKILNVKEHIAQKLQQLINEKGDFYYAITSNTSTRNSVATRFDLWLKVMKDCINKG